MGAQAVHEVKIPPQTPPGIQVPIVRCGLARGMHYAHFWNPDDGKRAYCPAVPGAPK
jgi:hypothetical protein